MVRLISVFDFLFGCRHGRLSRVFTLGGETYRVCCDCGAKYRYSLETMSIEQDSALGERDRELANKCKGGGVAQRSLGRAGIGSTIGAIASGGSEAAVGTSVGLRPDSDLITIDAQ